MTLFTIIKVGLSSIKEINSQKKYVKANVIPYLNELEEKHNGVIPPYQKKKIIEYYSLLIPSTLGVSFRSLYGEPFTLQDRHLTTMTGLVTPIFDDLFDSEKFDLDFLEKIVLAKEDAQSDTFYAKVGKDIQNWLLNTAYNKTEYIQASKAIFDSQVESLKQFDSTVSRDELQRITYTKAAASYTYYYTHLMGMPNTETNDVLYEVAGLQQISNDIADLYKDINDEVYTLANTCKDFTEFKRFFLEKVKRQNQKINNLPNSKKNKAKFMIVMLFIEGRALVILDHFIALEKKYGKGLHWSNFKRKDLVVDLEKPSNFIKWIYTTWRISNIR